MYQFFFSLIGNIKILPVSVPFVTGQKYLLCFLLHLSLFCCIQMAPVLYSLSLKLNSSLRLWLEIQHWMILGSSLPHPPSDLIMAVIFVPNAAFSALDPRKAYNKYDEYLLLSPKVVFLYSHLTWWNFNVYVYHLHFSFNINLIWKFHTSTDARSVSMNLSVLRRFLQFFSFFLDVDSVEGHCLQMYGVRLICGGVGGSLHSYINF